MDDKTRFLGLCATVRREGMDDLLAYLEKSDFFYAPASTRFHGAHAGGLLRHSLNVYDEFVRLSAVYSEIEVSLETAVIITLFHDLCKVNLYAEETRNRKNEAGQWESYTAYTRNEKFCYGGHGSKSVFIIQNYMKLTAAEAVAINCHMGAFENRDVGEAYKVLCNVSCHVGTRTIDFCGILSGKCSAAVRRKTAIGVHHNLSSGESRICFRSTDIETSRRIDQNFRIFIGGKNRQCDRKYIVQNLIFKFFDRFLPRVLNRYDHRFDPLSFAVFVFHCNLCFAIGHYTTKATLTLLNIDFPANVVCKHKRQRKHFLGFVGGVTVYCSLIACPK